MGFVSFRSGVALLYTSLIYVAYFADWPSSLYFLLVKFKMADRIWRREFGEVKFFRVLNFACIFHMNG